MLVLALNFEAAGAGGLYCCHNPCDVDLSCKSLGPGTSKLHMLVSSISSPCPTSKDP